MWEEEGEGDGSCVGRGDRDGGLGNLSGGSSGGELEVCCDTPFALEESVLEVDCEFFSKIDPLGSDEEEDEGVEDLEECEDEELFVGLNQEESNDDFLCLAAGLNCCPTGEEGF